MRYESEEDKAREKKAIEAFVDRFSGSYKKLDPNDIDYRIFDKDGKTVGYAEVKGRKRTIADAYPLPISAYKTVKLCLKVLNPVIIWACEDGIIYGKPNEIEGTVKWGGRFPRPGSKNDVELMIYYKKQKAFKYIRYY